MGYTLIVLTVALFKRLIALMCLMAFGLQSMFGSSFVRCTDAEGHSKVELVCVQDERGHCATNSDTSHDEHGPCDDSPLNERVLVAGVKFKSESITLTSPELTGILPPLHAEARVSAMLRSSRASELVQQRPPIDRLRTVILQV